MHVVERFTLDPDGARCAGVGRDDPLYSKASPGRRPVHVADVPYQPTPVRTCPTSRRARAERPWVSPCVLIGVTALGLVAGIAVWRSRRAGPSALGNGINPDYVSRLAFAVSFAEMTALTAMPQINTKYASTHVRAPPDIARSEAAIIGMMPPPRIVPS